MSALPELTGKGIDQSLVHPDARFSLPALPAIEGGQCDISAFAKVCDGHTSSGRPRLDLSRGEQIGHGLEYEQNRKDGQEHFCKFVLAMLSHSCKSDDTKRVGAFPWTIAQSE